MHTTNYYLVLSAMLVVLVCSWVHDINSQSEEERTDWLLVQNIEALTNNETSSQEDESPCNFGSAIYAQVAVGTGKEEVVTHYSDGANGSRGLDMRYTIGYYCCYALGSGSLRGQNFRWPNGERSKEELIECKGPAGHRNPIF